MSDAPTLSRRLREETKDAHTRAERAGIMRAVLRGRIGRDDYAALLAALLPIYEAMERGLARHAGDPALAAVNLDALARSDALRADLAAVGGATVAPSPTARAYADHLRTLDDVPALLGHAYVRYLGDLSGGQILRGLVGRALALDGSGGLSFYDFGDAERVTALKAQFRDALDALDPAAAERLLAEAHRAFALHERLFVELEPASA